MKNTIRNWVLSLLCVCFLAIFTGCVGGITGAIFDTYAPKHYTETNETVISQQREVMNLDIYYTTRNLYTMLLIIPIYTLESVSFEIHNPTDDDLQKLWAISREPEFKRDYDTFQYHPSGKSHPQRIPKRVEMREPVLYVILRRGVIDPAFDRKLGDPYKSLHEILNRLAIPLSKMSAKTYEEAFGKPRTDN